MLKKILLGLLGIAGAVVLGAGILYWISSPTGPASGSDSARWLETGPHSVGVKELVFEDQSRPTQANNSYDGSGSRRFASQLWFPETTESSATWPLLVYSHGFMSNRRGGEHYAAFLASHGYVVVAADYPLTNGAAPGGPNVGDVIHQATDVSFLIDSVIALQGSDKPFAGSIDTTRVGATGISLGGLTATLAGYHPRWRDKRVRAVASIAGPAAMFEPAFYQHAQVPMMMVAGTADAIVPYEGNADVIPENVANGTLVTINGGSHLGFVAIAEPALRSLDNPDSLGCAAILENVEVDSTENPFAGLGTQADGVVFGAEQPELCTQDPLPKSIHPGRQHMITKVALLSFFESVFAQAAARRDAAASVLSGALAADFEEVDVRS